MTAQQLLRAKLSELPLASKQIECYGSQIVITCWSLDAAKDWARVVGQFAKVRGVTQSVDYAKENKRNEMNPTTIPVWRVFGVIR